MIPSIIPEAVLGTKEPSEKARGAAFELILTMGRKMSAGGVVRRDLVDGMDEDVDGEGNYSLSSTVIRCLSSSLSYCQHRRIYDYDRRWFGGSKPTHD